MIGDKDSTNHNELSQNIFSIEQTIRKVVLVCLAVDKQCMNY